MLAEYRRGVVTALLAHAEAETQNEHEEAEDDRAEQYEATANLLTEVLSSEVELGVLLIQPLIQMPKRSATRSTTTATAKPMRASIRMRMA